MKFRLVLSVMVVFGGLALLAAPSALAQKKEMNPDIAYRQLVMKSIGSNMGGMVAILKKQVPHRRHVGLHIRNINTSARMIAAAFEKKVAEGPTDAKGAIWDDYAAFKKKADALVKESAALLNVMKSKDPKAFGAQMKKLGETCKSCHKDFRKPKEESFKRKK